MADIFVSYASEDRDRVKPLVEALQQHSWDVWWDRELIAGPSFDEKIEEALDGASCVVVVWSEHSVKSQWVRAEANEGLTRKVLVPLLLDDVRLPLAFRIAQTARLTDWPNKRGEFKRLVDGIAALLGKKDVVSPTPTQPDERKSIAVLPFVNMSNDPEQEYFSDGISEELINALVRVPQLEVTARTSSFQFKGTNKDMREIGKQLGVNHLLEGSVRKASNRVRVTAQLISVASGSHLWSDRFDRELTDIFEVQDEITAEIVKALHGRLAGADLPTMRTTNVEAYNAYLLGQYYAYRYELPDAAKAFRRAIEIDDTLVDAYVRLADIYGIQGYLEPGSADQETIDSLIARALELDPDNPSLAINPINEQFFKERQYQRAIGEASALLVRNPNNVKVVGALSVFCTIVGRHDEAIALARQATRIDPLAASLYLDLGDCLARNGQYSAAAAAFAQCGDFGGNIAIVRTWLAVSTNDMDEVKRWLDLGKESWGHAAILLYLLCQLIYLKRIGAEQAVEELVESLVDDDNTHPLNRVLVAAARNDVDEALRAFSSAFESGDMLVFKMSTPPKYAEDSFAVFPEFYNHPGFADVLKRNGLDQESLSRITVPPLPWLQD